MRGVRFAAFVLLAAWTTQGHAQTDLEYQVKAAFLFNFLKFVTWPADHEPAEGGPYVLCVIADERFTQTLAGAIKDKSIAGHPVQVRPVAAGAPFRDCHIAYLAPGPSPTMAESMLESASLDAVLTVHEADAAIASGVVRFFLEQQRVRFEINTAAAERRNLHLSSRLLAVAQRVQVSAP